MGQFKDSYSPLRIINFLNMPTFEKRRNPQGQVTSIRVKVRRVGLPHLSQSFPIDASNGITEAKAEKAARNWARQAETNLAAPQIQPKESQQPGNQGLIAKAWAAAISSPVAASGKFEEYLGVSRPFPKGASDDLLRAPLDALSRILLALALDCGLRCEELAALRWQHVHLDTSLMDVPETGGVVLRQVPLTPIVVSTFFAWPGRKYGPVFRLSPDEIKSVLEKLTPNSINYELLRLEAAFRMADRGLTSAEAALYLGVSDLKTLRTDPSQPAPGKD